MTEYKHQSFSIKRLCLSKFVLLLQCHPQHRQLLSLVSHGAERLCKLKPWFDRSDPSHECFRQILDWSTFKIFKTFEAFLLWVLVSFESQGLLISIIPVCSLVCGELQDQGPNFPHRLSEYIGSLKPITSFGKYPLRGITLENIGSWIRPVGFL